MKFPPAIEKQLVPFPGEPFALKLKKPEALEKVLGVKVSTDEGAEVARANELRVNRRYTPEGAWDRGTVPAAFVDLLVQRAGLAFTTGVLIKVCSLPITNDRSGNPERYQLRRDGQPWRRLREHLVASKDARAVESAHARAAESWSDAKDELRCALAFAFCDGKWVEEMIEPMFKGGYGRWSVLAAVTDSQRALALMERIVEADLRFQLYEEAVVFLPTLVKTAGAAGRPSLEKMLARAFSEKTKKPFAALLECY